MLQIHVPPTSPVPFTDDDFKNFELPVPSKGVINQNNDDTILLFDNEQEAVIYADQLEEIGTTVSNRRPEKSLVRDVVTAIRNDEMVRSYLE